MAVRGAKDRRLLHEGVAVQVPPEVLAERQRQARAQDGGGSGVEGSPSSHIAQPSSVGTVARTQVRARGRGAGVLMRYARVVHCCGTHHHTPGGDVCLQTPSVGVVIRTQLVLHSISDVVNHVRSGSVVDAVADMTPLLAVSSNRWSGRQRVVSCDLHVRGVTITLRAVVRARRPAAGGGGGVRAPALRLRVEMKYCGTVLAAEAGDHVAAPMVHPVRIDAACWVL